MKTKCWCVFAYYDNRYVRTFRVFANTKKDAEKRFLSWYGVDNEYSDLLGYNSYVIKEYKVKRFDSPRYVEGHYGRTVNVSEESAEYINAYRRVGFTLWVRCRNCGTLHETYKDCPACGVRTFLKEDL